MPYGKPYKRTMRRAYRKRKPRARKPPAGVRKKSTVKSVARRNWYKTQTLTRKVDYLLKARYGAIQTNLGRWNESLALKRNESIIFDMTDFTSARIVNSTTPPTTVKHARVFQLSGGAPNVVVPETFWTGGYWNSDLFNVFEQRDQCGDTGYYLPLYGEYVLEFNCKTKQTDVPPRVRIDMICHTKKGLIPITGVTTPAQNRTLPWACTYFPDLAGHVSQLNGHYFKRLKTEQFIMNNDTAMSNGGMAKQYRKSFQIKPKKPIRQMKSVPAIPGTTELETDVTSLGNYGPYNRDPRSPVWMIISTDAGDDIGITVQCTRKVKWRDPVGSSAL